MATRIHPNPIPAMMLLARRVKKLSSNQGRIPNPIAMNNAPMEMESFGPFLSVNDPAGQAKKITNIPMRDSKSGVCQEFVIPKEVLNSPSKGESANQFAPKAKITNQNVPTMTQRYLYSFCSMEYLSGTMIDITFLYLPTKATSQLFTLRKNDSGTIIVFIK